MPETAIAPTAKAPPALANQREVTRGSITLRSAAEPNDQEKLSKLAAIAMRLRARNRSGLALGAAIAGLEAIVYSSFAPQLGSLMRTLQLQPREVALVVMAYPIGTLAGAGAASLLRPLAGRPRAV